MIPTPIGTLLDRFAWLITWSTAPMRAEAYRSVDPALASACYGRFHRMTRRLSALITKWQAGTLPPIRPARPRKPATRIATPLPAGLQPWRVNWFRRLFPATTPMLAGNLYQMMAADPDMLALIAATPLAGRILRPICKSVGLKPPAHQQLPRRPRRPRPAAKPKPPRPVNINRLSSVAYGNLVNPEREPMGPRPPNRIGYARARSWPKRE